MTVRQTIWGAGDHEQRQRISREVQQLKEMSKTLRTTAMRSFMKRAASTHRDIKRPEVPVKPTSVAA